jgi:hypothetical protein
MIILGVDPGVTGGIAFLYPDGKINAIDIPNVAGEVNIDALMRVFTSVKPDIAIIERASSMPGQGVSSTFKFGVAYGALRALVVACGIPHSLVSPIVWKKHFRLSADKEQSRALAIRFWPGSGLFDRKKDHGRAEAALIAKYEQEVAAGKVAA